MSTPPTQPATYRPAQPRRSNNAVWWILGMVATGIIVMVLLGLMVAGLFLRHLRIHNSGNKVAIQTDLGSISVHGNNPYATGLEVYPGATPLTDNKGASIDLSANDTGIGIGIATETYETKDPIDFVEAWYKKRLGSDFRLETEKEKLDHSNGLAQMNDSDVAFVDDHRNGARIVALKKISAGTEITLLRVGKKETQ